MARATEEVGEPVEAGGLESLFGKLQAQKDKAMAAIGKAGGKTCEQWWWAYLTPTLLVEPDTKVTVGVKCKCFCGVLVSVGNLPARAREHLVTGSCKEFSDWHKVPAKVVQSLRREGRMSKAALAQLAASSSAAGGTVDLTADELGASIVSYFIQFLHSFA